MSITNNPKMSLSLLPAQLASSVAGRNDLICGTLLSSGASAVSGQLYIDVGKNYTNAELDALFGANSDLRNRIKQFIASNGGYSVLNVKAVSEEGGATASVGSLTFGTGTGVATASGTITVIAVDEFQWKKEISVAIGMTDDQVASAINDAFSSANNPNFPMVASVVDHVVTFTSKDKGTIGNNYKLSISGSVAGISTCAVLQPTGGATDPTVTTFFDNLQSTRFTGINWPTAWISQINVVKTYLDDRFNSDNAILDGVAFIGSLGTYAANKALVDAQNSQSLVYGGNQQFHDTTEISYFKPADWDMAYFQGIRARRLTQDAPISQFITTTAGNLDAFGGPALASLPYFNTPMLQTAVVNPNNLYSNLEQTELEDAGFSVIGVNSSLNQMICGPFVTTYTHDAGGSENKSFHYLNYVDTASICREYFFNNLKSRFSQSRLTNGVLVPGRSIENEESIKAEFVKIYKELSNLALTVAGSEAEKFYLKYLVVTLDLANRKVTSSSQLPIVTQLGSIIAPMQLNFNFQEGV